VAYRLKPQESVPAGVKRIAHEELNEAIERLRAGPRNGAVHEVRKHLKKVRALLRLVKGSLGAVYGSENARLREIGRTLSPVRDAEALIEAVDRVKDRRPELCVLRPDLVRRKGSVERRARLGELTPKLVNTLQAANRDVRTWTVDEGGLAVLEPGLRNAYKKGKKALTEYRRTGLREDLHEWRKRVKDHWYHVRLLQDLSGDALKDYERSLKELEDALGEDLNLSLLRERAAEVGENTAKAVDEEQRELRRRALEIGERLYEGKPKAVVKRMRELTK
jgi:CHAD domain-containing protein